MKHETFTSILQQIENHSLPSKFFLSDDKGQILYCSPTLEEQEGFLMTEGKEASRISIRKTHIEIQHSQGITTLQDERFSYDEITLHFIIDENKVYSKRDLVDFHGLFSRSEKMDHIFRIIKRISKRNVNVLIRGETGTGKELIAKAIHEESNRRGGPFVAVNCSAISPHLLESVLFGHKKGSFTGATHDHIGLFEQAEGGTLFLDEIGDMALELQSKLLRALEEREITPLGSRKSKRVDVRILSATHHSLRKRVANGLFRADLMYRLRVVPIFLPSLRDRTEDILPLFHLFLQKTEEEHAVKMGVQEDVYQLLLSHEWHGNIRELKNVVEYATAVCDDNIIQIRDLPPEFQQDRDSTSHIDHLSEKELLQKTLERNEGNIGKTAEELGMSRPTLWRKRKKYNL